jgi:hypothetical protein
MFGHPGVESQAQLSGVFHVDWVRFESPNDHDNCPPFDGEPRSAANKKESSGGGLRSRNGALIHLQRVDGAFTNHEWQRSQRWLQQ